MASLCERLSTSNVEQCDIERMHFLLQREALSVIGELQEQGIDNVANVGLNLSRSLPQFIL